MPALLREKPGLPAPDVFERQCHWLQTAPESGFVQTAVYQRYHQGELSMLRGQSLKIVSASGVEQYTLNTIDEYAHALEHRFNIHLPGIERLWTRVEQRHRERLQQQQVQQ